MRDFNTLGRRKLMLGMIQLRPLPGTPFHEKDSLGVTLDAVCLGAPDEAATLGMIASVREAVSDTPIILAGYTNHDNAARLLAAADGAFVGTCLERAGWRGAIDADRTRAYWDIVRGLE